MSFITQSPEAELDRALEELMGKAMRGTLDAEDQAQWIELQSRRMRLMRPVPTPSRHPWRKFA